jgi:hypothetical protein
MLICLVALLGSGLTLFSGFGLGTLLTPVFALFFPIDLAIAMTAIVHFLNNIFKLVLVGKHADKHVVLQFGTPSVVAAFLGAFLLKKLSDLPILTFWTLNSHIYQISLLKIIIGIVLIIFALWELLPYFNALEFNKKYLPVGGILSGFFGGLSGNQGALRAAFLSKVGLSKEAFIATGVVIACLIDMSRLTIYVEHFSKNKDALDVNLIAAATVAAFIGAYFGNKLLKKTTLITVQYIVATMLILFGIGLIAGII